MGIFDRFKSIPTAEYYRDSYNPAMSMFKNGQVVRDGVNSKADSLQNLFNNSLANTVSIEKMLASYSNNVIDYACVFAISNTLASLPVKLYQLDKDGQEVAVLNNESANTMLDRPSKMWSWYDFVEMVFTLMELTGYCVIENVNPDDPKELFPLRSDLVEVKVGANGDNSFVYRVNGHQITFDSEEAFQIKYANPTDFNRGHSAFNAMRLQQSIDYHSLKFMNSFFSNGGHLDGFLSYPIDLPTKKKSELYAQYEERVEGSSKAFKMMLLGKDVKYIPNQVKPQEANVSDIRDMQRADIITARGCYPIVLGFLDGASYANANIQWKLFYINTIKPKAQKFQDALNLNVFSKYGIKFKFDFGAVPELRADQKEIFTAVNLAMKSMAMTPNEVRARFDLGQPLDGGDELPQPKLPTNDMLIKGVKKKALNYRQLLDSK